MAVNQAQMTPGNLATAIGGASQLERKPQTYWSMAIQSLRRDRMTLVAMGFLVVLLLLSVFATPITNALVGFGPNETFPENAFAKPYIWPYIKWRVGMDMVTAPTILGQTGGKIYWLGADQLGRDQLARLLSGGQVSLTIAFVAAGISMLLGVSVGALAGYFGGIVDDIIMWFINTMVSIPAIYLLIIVSAIFSPSPITLTLFLGLFGWFGTARFMRGNVFKVRSLDYTLAARSVGARDGRIMLQHVIPNSIPVIIVLTAIDVGALILTESALSFLGLGIQPPTASWGSMLSRANNFLFLIDPATGSYSALHLLVAPGILITLT
ncbi:MAG: ABC transporter permease, partial [Caldilineaceae bacterium]|nr:ABC transporter permease [Caldilineaceae bacterium]